MTSIKDVKDGVSWDKSNNWIHYLDCSGINGSPPPYQTLSDKGATSYGATNTPPDGQGAPNPIVFCIHGNKYGIARCCDDLHIDGEGNAGPDWVNTRQPSHGANILPDGRFIKFIRQ